MKEQLVMKHDKVLVKPIDESEQLYGSIIVPDLGKEKPQIGDLVEHQSSVHLLQFQLK
jgi:co-chaperonin GroES (HSP10)